MDRIDICSGALEVEECLSNNEIRSEHLLGGVGFDIFIYALLIYSAFIL
jgi:hypothetical protein